MRHVIGLPTLHTRTVNNEPNGHSALSLDPLRLLHLPAGNIVRLSSIFETLFRLLQVHLILLVCQFVCARRRSLDSTPVTSPLAAVVNTSSDYTSLSFKALDIAT